MFLLILLLPRLITAAVVFFWNIIYCVYTQYRRNERMGSEINVMEKHRDDEDAMEVNDTTFMLSIQSLSIIANYIFNIIILYKSSYTIRKLM